MNFRKISFFNYFLLILVITLIYGVSFVMAGDNNEEIDLKISIIPSDPQHESQWYLNKIGAPKAWDITQGNYHSIIAILDTGVDTDHPDLKDNIWINENEIPGNGIDDDKNGYIDDVNGWDFVNNVADPNPKFNEGFTDIGINHGTIVAGIATAQGNNAFGISGVSWHAKIMPLKVLDDSGEGRASSVIKAIDYAIKNKADIINLSFVGMGFSASLEDAVKRAYNAGIIMVAAAGNEDSGGVSHSLDDTKAYPICYDGQNNMVIGVAASDALDQKATFSNFGFACVDITAPGTSFYSLSVYEPTKRYNDKSFNVYYQGYWSGTSMSAPLVSGSLALIKSVNPKLSRDEIVNILISSSDNISRLNPDYLGQLGEGRLNVFKAVEKIHNDLVSSQGLILSVPQSNTTSQVKIFNLDNSLNESFLSYDANFLGGSNITHGDLDGDGKDEIITGAGVGGGPHVRIFNQDGKVIGQFFAYDKNFRGGVNVSTGDLDNDGLAEIIVGSGTGGGSQGIIFDSKGKSKSQFFAYDKNFRGGVKVGVGDIDGDGKEEIITGTGNGGGPQVRVFDQNGKVKGQFFAYNKNFRGGVNIGIGDINQDGVDEIITGAGPGGTPHIRVFDGDFNLLKGFFGYNDDYNGGVNVAVIRVES